MSFIDELKDFIRDELTLCDKIEQEEFPKEINKEIEKIKKLSLNEDKSFIADLTNFEIVVLSISVANTVEFSYYQITSLLKPYETKINNWKYDDTKVILKTLFDTVTEEEKIKPEKVALLNKINLPEELKDYQMKSPLFIIHYFLAFKTECEFLERYFKAKPKISRRNKLKVYEKAYQDYYLDVVLESLLRYRDRNVQELNNKKQIVSVQKRLYADIINILNTGEINTMTDIEKDWKIYLHPVVVSNILLLINENLAQKYEDTILEKKKLDQLIAQNPLTKFLYENNINPQDCPSEILENPSFQSTDYIKNLDFFKSLGCNILKLLNNNIIHISQENKNIIKELIQAHALTQLYLENNLENINHNIKKIKTNYEILKPITNFKNPQYNENIINEEPIKIKDSLTILKEYDLSEENYIYLLCHFNYLYIYDLLLEHEISPNLFIQICHTNNPLNTIKRILICQQIDLPYQEASVLKNTVCEESKFICYDTDLDEYVSNVLDRFPYEKINGNSIKQLPEKESLDEKYKITNDLYMINDTLVSRPKVLRNLSYVAENNLDQEKYAFAVWTSNSIMSEKDLYNISNLLSTIKKTK